MAEDIKANEDVGQHIHGIAERLDAFLNDIGEVASSLKDKVESLIRQARSPRAAPTDVGEEVRSQLAQLDTILTRLAPVKDALTGVASSMAPETEGVVVSDGGPGVPSGAQSPTGGGAPETGTGPTPVDPNAAAED